MHNMHTTLVGLLLASSNGTVYTVRLVLLLLLKEIYSLPHARQNHEKKKGSRPNVCTNTPSTTRVSRLGRRILP